jgi:predicted metal-dependent phosphoesterase TrpH
MPAAAPTFDLQSHSTHSDGELPAEEVVQRAAQAGVTLLALTDHDSVDGVDEALAAAATTPNAPRIIPATEISALDEHANDLHILGYGLDHKSPGLLRALESYRGDRVARAHRMASALRDLGLALDESVVDTRETTGETVGRPHLAQAVVAHPANRERLQRDGLVNDSDVLEAYLIPGAPAFRPRMFPTIPEAIALIHDAGGLAVWAHPFWDVHDPTAVLEAVDRFAAMRIDGVEAFYVTHTREETELVAARCDELGLLTTGSADFHGPGHPRFSRFRAFDLYGLQPRLGPLAA